MPTPTPKQKESWRLDVTLSHGPSLALSFDTESQALNALDVIHKQGYVIEDRSDDPTKYAVTHHPIYQVKSLSVFKKE